MGKVSEEIEVGATLAEAWDFYFEPASWQSWVDGFHAVEAIGAGYPEAGSTLAWRSLPHGRGQVTEKVLEHEPRRLHRIGFRDGDSEGELLTAFEISGEKTKVRQELAYGLFAPGIFGPLTDRFFIRPRLADSLKRSLGRLKVELEAAAEEQ